MKPHLAYTPSGRRAVFFAKHEQFRSDEERDSEMRYRDDSTKGLVPFIILIIIAVFGLHACTTSLAQGNTHVETVTVCGKDVVNNGENGHEYRVYTSGATYVVKDYYGSEGSRFDSADLYGRIKVGETYIIRSFGYRVPWASSFWNIESVTSTDQKPTGTCG